MNFRKGLKPYYIFFIWILVIGYLCLVPADGFKKVHISIPYFDKMVHFGLFFILGVVLFAIKNHQFSKNAYVLLLLFSILYGGVIELAQNYLTTTRTGDWIDWFADLAGLLVGLLFGKYLPTRVIRFLK